MSEPDALPREIRGVMLPVTGGRVLVPNTNLAEVITYAQPTGVPDAPAWLLGCLTWRGWSVPVVAFAVLVGVASHESTTKTRVAILKAFDGPPLLPYFGVLTQGFPRLTRVSEDTLLADGDAGALPAGVAECVRVDGESAWIPDVAAIEKLVAGALAATG